MPRGTVRCSVTGMGAEADNDGGGGGAMIRAFVAVLLDAPVRAALESAIAGLRRCHARVSWVPGDNLHISLLFLGNVPRDMAGDLSGMLDRAAAGTGPFAVRIAGVGTFGERVVWAGVDAPPALCELQGRVAGGAGRLEIRTDTRPYRPHVTLGRVKGGAADLVPALRRLGSPEFGTVTVDRVALMRSVLLQTRAVHEPLHFAALR